MKNTITTLNLMKLVLFIQILLLLSINLFGNELNYSIIKKKDHEVILNKNKPNEKKLIVDFHELFSISPISSSDSSGEGFIYPINLQVDKNEDIYVFDIKNKNVIKFDKSGNYITKFGSKGSGPGEYQYSTGSIISGNKIIVPDQMSKKLVIFDKNGEFIKDIKFTSNFPSSFMPFSNNRFIGKNSGEEKISNQLHYQMNFSLYDEKFNLIKKLWYSSVKMNGSEMDQILETLDKLSEKVPYYTTNNSNIYFAHKSKNNYEIKKFDSKGNLILTIKKNHRKISRTKDEKRIILEKHKMQNQGDVYVTPPSKDDLKYKDSIIRLLIDKYKRLWVQVSKNDKNFNTNIYDYYDLFSETGIFLNTVTIEKEKDEFMFFNDKMYTFYGKDRKIKIYDY